MSRSFRLLRASASRIPSRSITVARSVPTTSAAATIARPSLFVRPARLYSSEAGKEEGKQAEEVSKQQKEGEDNTVAKENDASKDYEALLAEKDKQIASLQDMYRRALADAENVRQRTRKEVADAKEYSITKFAKDLLAVADVLDIAVKSVPQDALENGTAVLKDFHTGVTMTRSNLVSSFKRFNIEEFSPHGEKFDPNWHEALFQAPIPGKEAGTIFEVAKTGYRIGDRVLRPAQVGVVQSTD
ncbi:GrpE-domain-containing protein [Gaertneriomyces semiglobifer]|nr:GrpE-domain-containing protein [Gaertneriomyces semiglobifer]